MGQTENIGLRLMFYDLKKGSISSKLLTFALDPINNFTELEFHFNSLNPNQTDARR